MQNFDRQYRMTAGKPGSVGFEIGDTTPYALHIAFSIQKQELESSNTAKAVSYTHLDVYKRQT